MIPKSFLSYTSFSFCSEKSPVRHLEKYSSWSHQFHHRHRAACRLIRSLVRHGLSKNGFVDKWEPFFPPDMVFFFPTCQVRVVRFYVSCLLLLLLLLSSSSSSSLSSLSSSSSSSSLLNCDPRSIVFSAGPQPRPSPPSVPCRTSTTTIHAQCSLPDLNHDHPRPVFPSRTSTASIHAKCSLPDLM